MRALGLIAVLLSGPVAAEGALDRYATHGCAIAPHASRPADVIAAVAAGHASEQGGWLVIGPELCTIVPPVIVPTLKASDPDVAKHISAVDEYGEERGCFLDSEGMMETLQASRGWSPERAFTEYLALTGAGIFSGEWRFYGDSPLATPVGFQLTTGVCADVPYAAEMQESHADMIASFDGFIRANAEHLSCSDGGLMEYSPWFEFYESLGQGPIINAWHWFEISFALLASDWVTGVGLGSKGVPRPPLCRLSAALD
jgi:hypothetical protein